MAQWYLYSTIWEENILVIHYIYVGSVILLLYWDDLHTESDTCEMEIGIAGPTSTHKNISKYLYDNDIHTLQYGRIIFWQFSSYGAGNVFLLLCVHQDTESE